LPHDFKSLDELLDSADHASLSIVIDGNKETTYLLTYLLRPT